MTTLFHESFSSGTNLSGHTPDVGNAWSGSNSANITITGGYGYTQFATGPTNAQAVATFTETALGDLDVTIVFRWEGNNANAGTNTDLDFSFYNPAQTRYIGFTYGVRSGTAGADRFQAYWNGGSQAFSGVSLAVDTDHTVLITVRAGEVKWYLNGVLKHTQSPTLPATIDNLYLDTSVGNSPQYGYRVYDILIEASSTTSASIGATEVGDVSAISTEVTTGVSGAIVEAPDTTAIFGGAFGYMTEAPDTMFVAAVCLSGVQIAATESPDVVAATASGQVSIRAIESPDTIAIGVCANFGTLSKTTSGRYRILAFGHNNPDPWGVVGTFPTPTIEAHSGAALVKSFPKATLSASGTVRLLGILDADGTVPTISATGHTTFIGRATLTAPRPVTIAAYAGAALAVDAPVATISAHGLTGANGTLSKTAPAITISATGTVGLAGVLDVTAPVMFMSPIGRLSVTAPRFTLYATGRLTVSVEYEAYSATLIPSSGGVEAAVTRYTDYPFSRLFRWQGHYYGMASDGLYLLEGDDFDGTPIVSVVQTGLTDFGKPEMKRPSSLYFSGRIASDFTVTVETDELTDDEYFYTPNTVDGAKNHRALLGKGLRARYFSFGWSNENGGDWQLDSIDPHLAESRRKLWQT